MKISTSTVRIPVNIFMNNKDTESINNVLDNIRALYDWLDEKEINSITSESTGKVIETCELRRVCGILSGLASLAHWQG